MVKLFAFGSGLQGPINNWVQTSLSLSLGYYKETAELTRVASSISAGHSQSLSKQKATERAGKPAFSKHPNGKLRRALFSASSAGLGDKDLTVGVMLVKTCLWHSQACSSEGAFGRP